MNQPQRSGTQANMVLASLSNSSLRVAPISNPPIRPGPNCGGRFNNQRKMDQKLIEHIKKRSFTGIEKCIARGASIRTSEYKSDPPIMIAIDCGYKDIIKLLLQHKQLDVNEKALNGHTPLSYAKARGRKDIVKVLLDKGATG
ncbi:hypothetical protein ACHWQZ_G008533 [Mnemiopsis leidyi]